MSLARPNLDDRSFQMLVDQATRQVQQSCPGWNDLSAGDPGITLLETFAFLTETLIYRTNQIPDRVYIEFLRLLGVKLQPPGAACATLTFTFPKPLEAALTIPRGTRVATARASSSGESPVFSTASNLELPAGQIQGEVRAIHCDTVLGELLGKGTGRPGLSLRLSRLPIIANTGDGLDLIIGVEAMPDELTQRLPAIPYMGKMYLIWREVESFSAQRGDERVYVVDRVSGKLSFAVGQRGRLPDGCLDVAEKAIAAVPGEGREIRAWYRYGGGTLGNVSAGQITVLKDEIPGKPQVTNREAATGGRAVESLEHALVRGPMELHALERAVTARDFELLALRSGGVARARALTKAERWKYARPGTVEVVILPSLPAAGAASQQSNSGTSEQQTAATHDQVLALLNERRPLGTTCNVSWAKCKTVRIEAKVEARAEEDVTQLKQRLLDRIYQTLSPLPKGDYTGWGFGQSLSVSHIYDACLKEPGVRQVLQPRFVLEHVPDSQVRGLTTDPFHSGVWYAACAEGFFRSENDGRGWELFKPLSGESGNHVKAHNKIPGLLALCTWLENDTGSAVYISQDCGETWEKRVETKDFVINGAAWITRDGTPILMLATNRGLYELAIRDGAALAQVSVRAGDQDNGFHSVVACFDLRGNVQVAVAARNKGGVFLSTRGGIGSSFSNIGMAGEDVQVLAIQEAGMRQFLWAGLAAPAIHDPGKGCQRWELLTTGAPPDGWKTFSQGWIGGSCTALAFAGDEIYGSTYEAGVLRLPSLNDDAAWQAPPVNCGLPRGSTKEQLIERIRGLAVESQGRVLIAGGDAGLYRSDNKGQAYQCCSNRVFTDDVTVPPSWLFSSGEHSIEVRSNREPDTH
jgi:hypothetical protein